MDETKFGQFVLEGEIAEHPIHPYAYYDADGDCFEFIASDANYFAERLDSLVTVYRDMETQEVTGALIKSVSKFFEELFAGYPAVKFEIKDGRMKLEILFQLRLTESYKDPKGLTVEAYKELLIIAQRTMAELIVPKLRQAA